MGKARNELIRRLGGTPVDEHKLTDAQIMELAWDTYLERGEAPPAIQSLIDDLEKDKMKSRNQNNQEK